MTVWEIKGVRGTGLSQMALPKNSSDVMGEIQGRTTYFR